MDTNKSYEFQYVHNHVNCHDHAYRYSVMMGCWELEPDERPTFSTLVQTISMSLEDMADYLHITAFSDSSQTGHCQVAS